LAVIEHLLIFPVNRIQGDGMDLRAGGPKINGWPHCGCPVLQEFRTVKHFEFLPVVLYGCETWSLSLREERTLRVFDNRALRRVFGPKRDEVMGEWRKLFNEELRDL
jgi:hypothetical protein